MKLTREVEPPRPTPRPRVIVQHVPRDRRHVDPVEVLVLAVLSLVAGGAVAILWGIA